MYSFKSVTAIIVSFCLIGASFHAEICAYSQLAPAGINECNIEIFSETKGTNSRRIQKRDKISPNVERDFIRDSKSGTNNPNRRLPIRGRTPSLFEKSLEKLFLLLV